MNEMDLMGECARLNQEMLPYQEFVSALDRLAKKWLENHNELPKWW
jgi:hypothetical protein